MTLDLYPLRFRFVARERVRFPPGKAGNTIRGALGSVVRRIDPGAYARLFEPVSAGTGPSGLADPPRPFVIRAAALDGLALAPGDRFHFDLHLFEVNQPAIPCFVLSFAELAREGLGASRGGVELAGVDQLDEGLETTATLYESGAFLLRDPLPPVRVPLEPEPAAVSGIRLRFLTPTELKWEGRVLVEPLFAPLVARIRDRVSALRALYGAGPLEIDFRELGRRAEAVRMISCDIRRASVTRRSSKTGEIHPIGGFTGEAEYEGELAEFLPYLRAARWSGAIITM
jgi:hypothetical protein